MPKMEQIAPTLAMVGVDIAENGLSKAREVTKKIRHSLGSRGGRRDCAEAAGRSRSKSLQWNRPEQSEQPSEGVGGCSPGNARGQA